MEREKSSYRKIIIRSADLDTIMCGFLLGVPSGFPEVEQVTGPAPRSALDDPAVCCIECGGAGEPEKGNFDHHGSAQGHVPACLQTIHFLKIQNPRLQRLAGWAAARDTGQRNGPVNYPDLSNLISGIRLVHRDQIAAFRAGLVAIRYMYDNDLDPCGPLPDRMAWRAYLQAKKQNYIRLNDDFVNAVIFRTNHGRSAGYLCSAAYGVHGLLRHKHGCNITMAAMKQDRGRYKYSISSEPGQIRKISDRLYRVEPGWGGPAHGAIIGSPYRGSSLAPFDLREIIRTCC